MANKHTNLTALFTAIAEAIRGKTGSEEAIIADNFPEQIAAIETGVDTSDATAVASDIAAAKTAYVNGEKVTGTIVEYPSGNFVLADAIPYEGSYGSGADEIPSIGLKKTLTSTMLGRVGKEGIISTPAVNFGDATAKDVAVGKTFTSAAGVKVTGTATLGGQPANISIVNGSSFNIYVYYIDPDEILPIQSINSKYGQSTQFVTSVGGLVVVYKKNGEFEDDGSTGVTFLDANYELLVYRVTDTNGTIRLRDVV